MRAIVYRRVSSDDQVESGAGLAAQADDCGKWCQVNGVEAADDFSDEGVSGAAGLDKRPGLLAAIAALRKGDVLLVAKRDRLGRDPIVVAMAEAACARKGARVVSVAGEGTGADDPTSVLMRRIVDAFSEYERLVIKARTKVALQAKLRRSELAGAVPYGWDSPDGERLVENSVEQQGIATMRRLRAEGRTLREIAAALTLEGIAPKRSTRWSPMAVKKILDRNGAAV